jgi:hypothetical protein
MPYILHINGDVNDNRPDNLRAIDLIAQAPLILEALNSAQQLINPSPSERPRKDVNP